MKNKIFLFFSLLLFFNNVLYANLEEQIKKEAFKKLIKNNKKIKQNNQKKLEEKEKKNLFLREDNNSEITNKNIKNLSIIKNKYYSILIKEKNKIINIINKEPLNWEKIYTSILETKNKLPKEIFDKFLNYIFWYYINVVSNYKLNEKNVKKVINNLKTLINIIDVDNDKYANEISIVIHLILEDDNLNFLHFQKYFSTYYPYGVNDINIYYKYFALFNGSLFKYKNKQKFRTYIVFLLNNYWNEFYKNNKSYIPIQLVKKLLEIKEKYFNKITYSDLKYINYILSNDIYDSDAYYYKALYYEYIGDNKKMEENIKKSIQYNVYNSKAWLKAVLYYYNKKKYDITLNLINYYLKENTNNIKDFLFIKAKIYMKKGIEEKDIELLKIAKNIFTQINENSYLSIVKKYLNLYSNINK